MYTVLNHSELLRRDNVARQPQPAACRPAPPRKLVAWERGSTLKRSGKRDREAA